MKEDLLKKIVSEAIQKTGGPIADLERQKQRRFATAIDNVGGDPSVDKRLEEQGDEDEEAEAPAEDEAPAGEEVEAGEAGEGEPGEGEGDEDLESLFGDSPGGGGGAGGGGGGAIGGGPDEPGETPDAAKPEEEAEPEKPKKPRGKPIRKVSSKVKLNVDDLTFSLNTIRSGKSLKDPKVRDRINDYYKSLDHVERIAMHKYLRGLAQVIVGGVPGDKAPDPSDEPKPIHMELPGEDAEVSPTKKRAKDSSYVEDTKPPVRVVPGTNESRERVIRQMIRKILG